jgi:hypothetical protein
MPALDRDTMQRWREMVVVDRNGTTVGTITASSTLTGAAGSQPLRC